MFLNNAIFATGVCNGSIGVILDTNEDDASIKVAFPTADGIQEVDVRKTASTFYMDGALLGFSTPWPTRSDSPPTKHRDSPCPPSA